VLAEGQFEAVLRGQLDTESLLNLAQLSLEPLHNEEAAALIVQGSAEGGDAP
jgi:hypothetical protein